MDSSENKLFTKKNIINGLVILILLLAIPAAISLLQKSQIFKSRASVNAISFPGPNITQAPDGTYTTTSSTIQVQLNSPKRAAPTPTPVQ